MAHDNYRTNEEGELKEELIECMNIFYQKGLISATGGNASFRLPNTEELWITPSGVFKSELRPDDMVKLDLEGNILEGILKPSKEWPIHTMVYNKRADINAVIHTHSPISLGLTIGGVEIKPITPEAAVFLPQVPVVPFKFPGTQELADEVAKYVMDYRILILENHGPLGMGYDIKEARTVIEVLEEVSTILLVAHQVGEPKVIPQNNVESIRKLYRLR